jgi:hypothetical protein
MPGACSVVVFGCCEIFDCISDTTEVGALQCKFCCERAIGRGEFG